MKVATVYMERSMAGAALQCESQNFSMFEHPQKASSWKLRCVEDVRRLAGVSLLILTCALWAW